MRMNQRDQKWLVLLYSLAEMGGGGRRSEVLRHIQQCGYWRKNDLNDMDRDTRREKTWRNDLSYERMYLVDRGYMLRGARGEWRITDAGKAHLDRAVDALRGGMPEGEVLFTEAFRRKVLEDGAMLESEADGMLIERLAREEDFRDSAPAELPAGPRPKGAVLRSSGGRSVYLRDPAVARRALARAGHRCEIDAAHVSFPRRNSPHLYMEPHHLIPMSMTDEFGVSLDREQNIFCLCSNCHNQIHYGRKQDVRKLISQLFSARAQEIRSILGREIDLEEIWQIYGV